MKTRNQLALCGGDKTISNGKEARFVWPPLTKKIERSVLRQLKTTISIYDRSGIFEEFENAFGSYHNRKRALVCSSGTLAIHSMFVAADFKEGDEVICPAYTFFATVTPLLQTGAIPVLCDSDENGNIDPKEIEKSITPKTKGVVVTHMWGIPCQMDEITALCKKHKLILLEDCSHAHGTKYKGKLVGTFGAMAAWSLQGAKTVTGGEGGVFATDDDELYYRALLLGHYNKRCRQELPKDHPFHKFAVTGMGLKYRAHPLAIAIAKELFDDLEEMLAARNNFARVFCANQTIQKVLRPPAIEAGSRPSWYALVFQYQKEALENLDIEKFTKALQAEGLVEVDRPASTSPLNLLPLFETPQELFPVYLRHPFSYKKGDFPKAETFYQNAIKIPIWSHPKDKKVMGLYEKGLVKVIKNYRELLTGSGN